MGNTQNQYTNAFTTHYVTTGGGPFASAATKKRARLARELDRYCQQSLSANSSSTSSSSSSSSTTTSITSSSTSFRDVFLNRRGSSSSSLSSNNNNNNLSSTTFTASSSRISSPIPQLQSKNKRSLPPPPSDLNHPFFKTFVFPTNSHWEESRIRRAVVEGKLAPLYKGLDYEYDNTSECPICFLAFPSLNNATCCRNMICSTCFLQLRPVQNSIDCPFCKHNKVEVKYLNSETTNEESIQQEIKALEIYRQIIETSLMEENDTLFQQNLNLEKVTGLAEMHSVKERVHLEQENKRQMEAIETQKLLQEEQRNLYRERILFQQSRLSNLRGNGSDLRTINRLLYEERNGNPGGSGGTRGRRQRRNNNNNDHSNNEGDGDFGSMNAMGEEADNALTNIIVRGRNGSRRQMLLRQGDLNQIEELMIMQAMQMSLEDSGGQDNRDGNTDGNNNGGSVIEIGEDGNTEGNGGVNDNLNTGPNTTTSTSSTSSTSSTLSSSSTSSTSTPSTSSTSATSISSTSTSVGINSNNINDTIVENSISSGNSGSVTNNCSSESSSPNKRVSSLSQRLQTHIAPSPSPSLSPSNTLNFTYRSTRSSVSNNSNNNSLNSNRISEYPGATTVRNNQGGGSYDRQSYVFNDNEDEDLQLALALSLQEEEIKNVTPTQDTKNIITANTNNNTTAIITAPSSSSSSSASSSYTSSTISTSSTPYSSSPTKTPPTSLSSPPTKSTPTLSTTKITSEAPTANRLSSSSSLLLSPLGEQTILEKEKQTDDLAYIDIDNKSTESERKDKKAETGKITTSSSMDRREKRKNEENDDPDGESKFS